MDKIFEEIRAERKRQDEKFGEQNHLMLGKFYSPESCEGIAKLHKEVNRFKAGLRNDCFSWLTILLEEVYEVFAETDPKKQREEMIQVAAVAVNIIQCLERKNP